MGGPRSKASPEEIRAAFLTDEPFKAVAVRLGMSPNTLRSRWADVFGDVAFAERGKRIQSLGAVAFGQRMAGVQKNYGDVLVVCSVCRSKHTIKSNRAGQMDDISLFVCDLCQGDRYCPVCGLRVAGERGMAQHLRHRQVAGDRAHVAYSAALSDAPFKGKTEGEAFVACKMPGCTYRADTLARHLTAVHGMTADEYREMFPGALIRSAVLLRKRQVSTARAKQEYGTGKGARKNVICPSCDAIHAVSKFLVPGTHDMRCTTCKWLECLVKEEAQWADKTEPEDFVRCRVCLCRAENLTSHIQSAHPRLVGKYADQYPSALLVATGSKVRDKSAIRANLTRNILVSYMNAKGRVEVAKAAEGLGCSWLTVLRYCRGLGIPTRNKLAFQKRVLDTLSDILEEPYIWEWSHPDIVNPETGYRLYFDGYFPSENILVEVHGKQHYEFVPGWHKTEDGFMKMKARDAYKAQRARELGIGLMVVKYDDPVNDPWYFLRRLFIEFDIECGDYIPTRRPELVGDAPKEMVDVWRKVGLL